MREKRYTVTQFFVELLVVFSIICFVSSLIYVIYNNSQLKAKDAERILALVQIRNALELYRSDHPDYPDYLNGRPSCGGWAGYYADYIRCWEDLEYKLKDYIRLPKDPDAGINGRPDRVYWYKYNPVSKSYLLLMKPQNSRILERDQDCYINIDPTYYCIGNK